jgi:hypothetical protein
MTYIWNSWIGYSKPLMDFRNDGPMPSPPDDPPADECFWHSCATAGPATTPSGFDLTAIVVPSEYDALVAVEAAGFDLSA